MPFTRLVLKLTHIFQVKTGPFHEHSNQLWNISAVPNWQKVNEGMFKMYQAEVSVDMAFIPTLSL